MKTLESIHDMVVAQPFWKGLPGHYMEMVAGCARLEEFTPRQTIFCRDNHANAFYIIRSGRVAIETPYIPNKGMLCIDTLEENQALGWSWFFFPYQWHFNASAISATEVLAFDTAFLREQARTDHEFGYELVSRMAKVVFQRLQATRFQLMEVYAAA